MLTCRHALDCRLKIKLSGSSGSGQANGQGNGQGSSSGRGSKGGGEHDRWMADCADCGEEGDLLCCEVCLLTLLLLGSCPPCTVFACQSVSSSVMAAAISYKTKQ